jgi:hypothetical protein
MARAIQDETTVDTNDRIAAVLEQLAAQAPVQEIGFGHPKYQDRLKAEGFFDEFEKPVLQNGKRAEARGLKPETIARAPQLRVGTYLKGKVEVQRNASGHVNLVYAHAKVEDRMRFQAIVRDFDDLIDQIWTEMSVS